MVLIIGIGKSILDSYYTGMSSSISLKEMGVIFVVALALLYLSNKIPALIGDLPEVALVGLVPLAQVLLLEQLLLQLLLQQQVAL